MKKRNPILENKKIGLLVRELNSGVPRCYWRKEKCKISRSVLIKCSCCEGKVRIYYDNGNTEPFVEINGVLADRSWWKTLFKEIGIIE
jgi:hypothetical protein